MIGVISEDLKKQIRDYGKRIRTIRGEILTLKEGEKDVLAEAKANGIDTKILNAALKLMEKSADEVNETQDTLDLYLEILQGKSNVS